MKLLLTGPDLPVLLLENRSLALRARQRAHLDMMPTRQAATALFPNEHIKLS